ncbi:hypothetical protein N0V93_000456 [Gnomoniopsis smithogilvyi]|uniref:Thioredoxin-like fold domain-containing protein n=1 Tax=Gnomoniopsis smithogilvyi TaxID=1191159 RepID=A0A9W8Z413_9PEZI|nr:hypothetical protein N0V93_000456 [Gnomoniopsis smithogilvyi]
MTSTQSTPTPSSGPAAESERSSQRDWIPPIPRPLQQLFDSVPLVTYPPNELPYRSPARTELPTLHVFITETGAARGLPSFNPSCLKWQTFLRIAGVQHNLDASTNHASPTGSLPFLQPALTGDRLDPRQLLPIPSSRLDLYAQRHGSQPSPSSSAPSSSAETPDQQHLRQQAYQSLLDTPIRNAWLYALYLSPANERLLRKLYITPVSRASLVQRSLLSQLRAAARAEIAKAADAPVANGWALEGNLGDLLTWALSGRTVLDPEKIYAEARRAVVALETLLGQNTEGRTWFFDAARPTLFDAHVFSYTYLILNDDYIHPDVDKAVSESSLDWWGDETLRKVVRDCPRLVEHAETMLRTYWSESKRGLEESQ